MRTLKFLCGVAVGLGVGWLAGTLLSPESGESLGASARRRIKTIIEEGRHAAEERMAEMQQQFEQAKTPKSAGAGAPQ